jgi:hypothetical protein
MKAMLGDLSRFLMHVYLNKSDNENNINNIVYNQVQSDMAKDLADLELKFEKDRIEGLESLKKELETNLGLILITQYTERSSTQVLNTIKTTLANCNISDKGDIKCIKPIRNKK